MRRRAAWRGSPAGACTDQIAFLDAGAVGAVARHGADDEAADAARRVRKCELTGFDTSAVRVSPTSALGFGRDDGVTTAPTTSAYSTSRAMATTGARQVGQAA